MKKVILFCVFSAYSTLSLAQAEPLKECRIIDDGAARVSCYDAYVDALSSDSPQVEVTESTDSRSQVPVVQAKPVLSRETQENLFGSQGEDTRRIIEEELGIPNLDHIDAKVNEVSTAAYKRLVFVLDNGQTWQQTDSVRLSVRQGDDVTIKSGSLGSYLLEKASGSRSIRVKRVL